MGGCRLEDGSEAQRLRRRNEVPLWKTPGTIFKECTEAIRIMNLREVNLRIVIAKY
jgi:hypothetical protein